MQTAHCLLSLGGDHGNQVMKWGVTVAEIAVLRAIHGDEAVTEVEPHADVKRSHREERMRLIGIYGGAKTNDGDPKPIVESMFPGIAARVFENLHELDLPESFFKATGRLKAAPAIEAAADPELGASDTPPTDETDEGVGDDINDAHADKDILG